MKKIIVFLLVAIAVLLVAGVVPVSAHGGFRASVWIGPGWWGPWWGGPYYPYYYAPYYAPPVVIERQPPVYEYEQPAPQVQEQQYYWYFCPDSKAYYPYVKQCPSGWMKVIPSPPKGRE